MHIKLIYSPEFVRNKKYCDFRSNFGYAMDCPVNCCITPQGIYWAFTCRPHEHQFETVCRYRARSFPQKFYKKSGGIKWYGRLWLADKGFTEGRYYYGRNLMMIDPLTGQSCHSIPGRLHDVLKRNRGKCPIDGTPLDANRTMIDGIIRFLWILWRFHYIGNHTVKNETPDHWDMPKIVL